MKQFVLLISICLLCACKVKQPISSTRFADDVRKDIPFKVNSFAQVANHADIYTFKCDNVIALLPDYEVDAEGVVMVYRTTFVPSGEKQQATVIWRNIVINHKAKRVLCIDRLLKDGKTFGYVYVLQADTKEYSDELTYHFDVSDHRLMLTVSNAIESKAELSVTTLNTLQQ